MNLVATFAVHTHAPAERKLRVAVGGAGLLFILLATLAGTLLAGYPG